MPLAFPPESNSMPPLSNPFVTHDNPSVDVVELTMFLLLPSSLKLSLSLSLSLSSFYPVLRFVLCFYPSSPATGFTRFEILLLLPLMDRHTVALFALFAFFSSSFFFLSSFPSFLLSFFLFFFKRKTQVENGMEDYGQLQFQLYSLSFSLSDLNKPAGSDDFFPLRFITFAKLPVLLSNIRIAVSHRISANNTGKRTGTNVEKYSPLSEINNSFVSFVDLIAKRVGLPLLSVVLFLNKYS